MKKITDYVALAWKELRAQFKQVFTIILVAVMIGMVAVCALYGSIFWVIMSQSIASILVTCVVGLLLILTLPLLSYYVPVWFLALVRKQKPWYEVKAGYLRALFAAFVVLLPTILSQLVNGVSQISQALVKISPVLSLVLSLFVIFASLLVLAFTIWWTYAVGHVMPFRVHDHQDRSVLKSIGDTMRMMKGYKLNLFLLDLLIMAIPYVVIFVSVFVMIIAVAFVVVLAPDYTVLAAVIAGVLALPLIAEYTFVVEPMLHFAHVMYYEDMRAELGLATPAATDATEAPAAAETKE